MKRLALWRARKALRMVAVSRSLTDKGFAVVDEAVTAHVQTQEKLVSGLSAEEHRTLDALLKTFQDSVDTP
ncbi:MAG: hypothetical protein HKN05_08795 [Rhizobiales bacterium]|nr:hypothetical protein [Hyphomicrobiales bacterium]